MEWKPASVAGAYVGPLCSNPGAAKQQAAYTFGHKGELSKTGEQDLAASRWWAVNTPTTNQARNSDVEGFWQDTTADGDAKTVSESITYTTGRDIAKRVKESGRGSNLSLSQNYNNDVLNKSLYKETFCKARTAPAPGGERAETETNYWESKKAAKANKALGRGSSVNLKYIAD